MKKSLKELLKSGNFTIYYHDNQACCLYEGKYTQEEIEEGEFESVDFPTGHYGYIPDEVRALVYALGGEVHSV